MEFVEEELKWTNLKTFKIALSDDLSVALTHTKQGNKLYTKGDYKAAGDEYKKALPIWNKLIKELKAVPETDVGGWFSMANWVIWVPLVNFALIIAGMVQELRMSTALPNGGRYITPQLQQKLNEAMQTKSFSKQVVMQTLVLVQDFTEDRAKECSGNKPKSMFEGWMVCAAEGYADAVIECLNHLDNGGGSTQKNDTYAALESYIQSYV